jgi:arsenate reductase
LVGWESIFNKKSATWKQIADNYKLINEKVAIDIMLKNNIIIKRPVIETGKRIMVGYNLESIADFLKK